MALPPYKFYNTNCTNNLSLSMPLSRNTCILRLHTLTFSTETIRKNLTFKIELPENKKTIPIEFQFTSLFSNPFIKNTLFFKNGKLDYTDIELPSVPKLIKFSIIPWDITSQFEVSLNCMYLKNIDKRPDLYSQKDFDRLKVNKIIQDLCDRCIDAEGFQDIWPSVYSSLHKEVESIMKKKLWLCDLPDTLIEFRKITS